MLNKVLETNKFVVDNAKHVKINYDKVNELIDELLRFDNVNYLTKVQQLRANFFAMIF